MKCFASRHAINRIYSKLTQSWPSRAGIIYSRWNRPSLRKTSFAKKKTKIVYFVTCHIAGVTRPKCRAWWDNKVVSTDNNVQSVFCFKMKRCWAENFQYHRPRNFQCVSDFDSDNLFFSWENKKLKFQIFPLIFCTTTISPASLKSFPVLTEGREEGAYCL